MSYLHSVFIIVVVFTTLSCSYDQDIEDEENRGRAFMKSYNEENQRRNNVASEANWEHATNLTEENLKKKIQVAEDNAAFSKQKHAELTKFPYKQFKDQDLKRQFKKSDDLGVAALPPEKYKEVLNVINDMESNYAMARICSFDDRSKCDFQLEPELTEIFKKSRNPEELKYYWIEWYNKTGTPVKNKFLRYVELVNDAAKLNHYKSYADYWLHDYEDDTIEQQLEDIFDQLRPFYQQLHAYVRGKLIEKYGKEVVPEKGPIPMHLLGNMWAQSWNNIADFTSPYPEKPQLDVTPEMIKQGYTPLKMFQKADDFFDSMGLKRVPQTFWDKSVLEKPSDGRDLVCHASAWDFYKTDDVRIKQCTRVDMEEFFVVHHEMGHIQYYLQYQHLPMVYREGANPGFHEAVGDVLSLSVSTPRHLKTVGLIKDFETDKESIINQLYISALSKIAFPPFAYTLDKYRWAVFRGEVKEDELNTVFWDMRLKSSGVAPPVERGNEFFDPPAKYHISADVEYLRYLIAYIVQYQFHKSLCLKAGQYNPSDPNSMLCNCDIYNSKEAGEAMAAMLKMGSSKPWPDAMEAITGQRKMEASAILEYYKPLQDWLEEHNKKSGVHIGW